MCLYNPKQITTDKDIVCYKILRKVNDDTYVSPYFPKKTKKWILNKTKKTKNINIYYPHGLNNADYISNAFHSLKTIQDVLHYSDDILASALNSQDYFVFKCVIPKSSVIYEGLCIGIFVTTGYASNQIKPIELICPIKEIKFSNEYINFCYENLLGINS